MTLIDMAPPTLVGIIAQEVLQWYKLSSTSDNPDVMKHLKNIKYWICFGLVCVLGTLFMYYYIDQGSAYKTKDFVLFGAAFPTIMRQAVAGANGKSEQKLGSKNSLFSDYFR
ncbi:hypothetical protein Q8W71_00110 [Methylobacterium sp. NEAU 140]|uniref:hypothetical protein n=1 Tax=Methylobacterium sp. NEAU 140 TaxID=3064945 RepID=UPI0027351547|nr:hypothetical protein [Methylobacterium sp. NEAU 140]MDP4021013.1 hypothetical protein [Methylobacterium sp. NEAU 140]